MTSTESSCLWLPLLSSVLPLFVLLGLLFALIVVGDPNSVMRAGHSVSASPEQRKKSLFRTRVSQSEAALPVQVGSCDYGAQYYPQPCTSHPKWGPKKLWTSLNEALVGSCLPGVWLGVVPGPMILESLSTCTPKVCRIMAQSL